jgi:PGF-CTERM protein
MLEKHHSSVILAFGVVVGTLAIVAVLAVAATPVSADGHTKATADDYTEEANFTTKFPSTTDHYPGDQNEANGSIEYFATGEDAVRAETDEEGVFMDFIIIDADWIDYSECDIPNTKAFGIDRGSTLPGTQFDDDLVPRQKNTAFRDDGLTIEFYDFGDFANDPPYAEPVDEIVAAQGAGSQSGTCLTVTSEPGWYQLQGFINGTEADNGRDTEPSENADRAGINVNSNYLYVCECDSRAEAEEQLGPPPGTDPESTPEPTPTPNEGGDDSTPTPTAESTSTPTAEPTPAPTSQPTATPEDTPEPTDTPDNTPEPTATPGDTGNSGTGGDDGNTGMTPTAGSGPGFGSVLAILALLATSLLVGRQR